MSNAAYIPIGTRGSVDNLRSLLNQATEAERTSAWYATAREQIRTVAVHYGLSFDTVARMVAVLSPRCAWRRNIEAAVSVIQGEPLGGLLGANVVKAQRILAGDHDALRGPKVTRFYTNLVCPGLDDEVTVDSHAVGAWLDLPLGSYIFPEDVYHACADDYRALAREVGMPAKDVQAIVWEVRKRVLNSRL